MTAPDRDGTDFDAALSRAGATPAAADRAAAAETAAVLRRCADLVRAYLRRTDASG